MDNNMMQMMMQMMMQNQQMMNMMMAQAMQQGTQTQTPMMSTVAQSNETMSAQPSDTINAQIADLQRQIAELKNELKATKSQLATEKQANETAKAEHMRLKSTVSKAEAYLGETIEDIAAKGENLSGDDYYDEKKEEWNEKGLDNKEMHNKIKEFKDTFKKEDIRMLEF